MHEHTDLNTTVTLIHVSTLSVKSDADMSKDDAKTVTVRTTFNNVPLRDVVVDAVRTDNIRFQRELRKRFGTITDGDTVERTYNARPATVDPETATVTFLSNMSPEQREQWLRNNMPEYSK